MANVIEASNIVKSYDGYKAVNGVSFQVKEGECYGLLGPNGAGKTSIFKMIYGSAKIDGGDLFVLGLNAKSHMKKIKSLVGVVPQENGLDPDFSVLDNLYVYGSYFGISKTKLKERAFELLAIMQLEEHVEKTIEQLSGGMKRRLVLARALLTKPKLIFLDEPTTGLDPQARIWIWNELQNLQKTGSTILLTTHYMEEAEAICDRLLIMNKGKAVVEGTPEHLIATHIGKEVIEFEVSEKELEYFVGKIEGRYGYQAMRNRLKLFIKKDQNSRDVIGEIQSANITMRKATLNDVFLKISGHELHD
ncbi:MAG: ABC transporter ATP-binding protein [Bdellovibrionales bacterium]